MKVKKYKEKYSDKVNKNLAKKNKDFSWIIRITIAAFLITLLFSLATENVLPYSNTFISILIIIIFIILGVLFDMIGIAVTVATPKTFNSMATKNVRGSRACINLIKKASKVSSFCNDVIGDICGILSGSAGVTVALTISKEFNLNLLVVTIVITSIIGALTIGGKAMGKNVAINKSNEILYKFAEFLMIFNKKLDSK